jgi:hypothetical protein
LETPEDYDSDAEVNNFFLDFMNDPDEAQIEAQIIAQTEAQQRHSREVLSCQYQRFRRRHIERDHGAARD